MKRNNDQRSFGLPHTAFAYMVRLLLSPNPTLIALLVLGRSSARRTAFITPSFKSSLILRSFSGSTTTTLMTKKVLVPIADGSEEIETTAITDTLTRFGAEVTVASVKKDGALTCTMSRGIKVRVVVRFQVEATRSPCKYFQFLHCLTDPLCLLL